MWNHKEVEYGKYKHPQFYGTDERISIIEKHLAEGFSFHEIGVMFSGVGHQAIEYHWKRYKLKTIHKKKAKKQKDDYREYLIELSKAGLV